MIINYQQVHKGLYLQSISDILTSFSTLHNLDKINVFYVFITIIDNLTQISLDELEKRKKKRLRQLENYSEPYTQFRIQKNIEQERLKNPSYTLENDQPL